LTPAGQERVAQATDRDTANALYRTKALHPDRFDPADQLPEEVVVPIAPRTLSWWRELEEKGESEFGSGFVGLLTRCGARRGRQQIKEVHLRLIDYVRRHVYLRPAGPGNGAPTPTTWHAAEDQDLDPLQ